MVVGVNSDVISSVLKCYELFKDSVQEHVKYIRDLPTIDKQCQAIFANLAQNVRYREDNVGEQLIKSPARLLSDGEGDCKSFALYINSCLHCLGIPHKFRFVNFDGGRQYTHVYAVALDEDGEEILLDAVEVDENGNPIYDYARPYSAKKDYNVL